MAARLSKSRVEYRGLERKIKNMEKECKQLEEQIEGNKQKKAKTEKDAKHAHQEIHTIETRHPWVLQEREYFGQGEFDFEGMNIGNLQHEYDKTKDEIDHIGKRINKKVSSTLNDHL